MSTLRQTLIVQMRQALYELERSQSDDDIMFEIHDVEFNYVPEDLDEEYED